MKSHKPKLRGEAEILQLVTHGTDCGSGSLWLENQPALTPKQLFEFFKEGNQDCDLLQVPSYC